MKQTSSGAFPPADEAARVAGDSGISGSLDSAAQAVEPAKPDHPALIRAAALGLAEAIIAGAAAGYSVQWPHSASGLVGIAVSETGLVARASGPAAT